MTVINHTYRFLFVHVPKNAGTAVARYLSQLSTYRDQEIGATDLGERIAPDFRARFGLHKHSTYREIEAIVGDELMGRYATLAVARDPYERARSTYSFLRRWHGWHDLSTYARYVPSFQEHDFDAYVRSDFFRTPGPDMLLMPQSYWLADADSGGLLVDHLLRVEDLSAGLERFVETLGLPRDRLGQGLERVNVSGGRGRPQLDASTRELILERYRGDFETLGYPV